MSLALAYWIIMLVWLVLGVWTSWPNLRAGSGNLILFVLLVIIGWKLFGAPVHT